MRVGPDNRGGWLERLAPLLIQEDSAGYDDPLMQGLMPGLTLLQQPGDPWLIPGAIWSRPIMELV